MGGEPFCLIPWLSGILDSDWSNAAFSGQIFGNNDP